MESLDDGIRQLSVFVAIVRVKIGKMGDVFRAFDQIVCHTRGTVTYREKACMQK
jgi:hypothetical protein